MIRIFSCDDCGLDFDLSQLNQDRNNVQRCNKCDLKFRISELEEYIEGYERNLRLSPEISRIREGRKDLDKLKLQLKVLECAEGIIDG
jgi:hypothetical protein